MWKPWRKVKEQEENALMEDIGQQEIEMKIKIPTGKKWILKQVLALDFLKISREKQKLV